MKLIKINTDHYVVVDDSEIKEGDYFLSGNNNILHYAKGYTPEDTNDRGLNCKKITHSTQPLGIGWQQEVIELSLQEVKELIGEVDVEKKAESYAKDGLVLDTPYANGLFYGYIKGYTQALEDNKEKKYTEEDVISIVKKSRETGLTAEYLLLSFQPKTEWEVEIVDGKLKLK